MGFQDFTPLLADPEALRETVDQLATWVKEKDCDIVIGAEARGFILGAAIAAQAGVGFVPARRPGKLPPETISVTYALEYGQNSLELHPDLIPNPIPARTPIPTPKPKSPAPPRLPRSASASSPFRRAWQSNWAKATR